MKKIKIITAIILSTLFVGCTDENSHSVNEQSNNRIKLKEQRVVNGDTYSIIEIDSVEYLTQYHGGFVKLEK